ncbi:serine hydrolase domain-containing protein [Glycomyces albidus]|uniref:Serine hydrolase n=1 Tax=Glycomyces albidus TaxID=2656774 RepID=A0A6L5GBH9_9ACTN|nr:serine hydrolase domain-containing protein [Glycomyces albidus]MQM27027.1 serine hydrolase [Glycomyces albidus]
MTPVLTAAALAICLAAVPTARTDSDDLDTDDLDTDRLQTALDDLAALGDQSIVVEVRGGDETWAEAVGPRSLEAGAADAEADDRIRIGSVTKSMTAAVLVQLDGEGVIDLDDPLSAYLPDLLPYAEEPTIREIMQHKAGLPEFLFHLYGSLVTEGDMTDVYANYRTYFSPEELVALGVQDPILFEPGEGWSYSNTGYTALGILIEEVTGNRLGTELRERVFEPAGLGDTYLANPGGSGIRGPHLTPYLTTGDPGRPFFDTTRLSNSQLWAGGGVVSTMGDLNDFYDALLDGTILTADQLAEATAFQETGRSFGYGLGLFAVAPCPDGSGQVYTGHDGDSLGHETQSFHSLDGERQVSVAWNVVDRHGYTDPDEWDAAVDALIAAALCG